MAIYKLGKICKVHSGGDMPKINSKIQNLIHNIPIIGNGINNSSILGYTNLWKEPKDTISISARGTIGHILYHNENYFPIIRLITLLPNKNIVYPKFLYYVLKKTKFMSTGAVQKQLTIPNVKKVEIFLPTLKIQKQIIDIIEPIEKCIYTLEKIINLIKEKLKLKYLLCQEDLIYFSNLISLHFKKYNKQNLYLATNAFGEFLIDYSKIQDISINKPSRANLSPMKNSMIISKLLGENKIMYFQKEIEYVISTGFYNFKSKFLDHISGFLLSNNFTRQKKNYSSGTTMIGLNKNGLNKIKIKKPSFESNKNLLMLSNLLDLNNKFKFLKNLCINLLIK